MEAKIASRYVIAYRYLYSDVLCYLTAAIVNTKVTRKYFTQVDISETTKQIK